MDRNFTFEFHNFTSPINPVDGSLQHQRYLEQYKQHAIAISVLNVALCLTAVVTNSAMLIAIWKTPSLHSPSNILLANLALSDLGVGLIVQPWEIFLLLVGIHRFSSTYRFLCRGFYGVANRSLACLGYSNWAGPTTRSSVAFKVQFHHNSLSRKS